MGNWAIIVEGTGAHHNKNLLIDANRMAAVFVQQLRNAGHIVERATFTHSGRDYIDDNDYLSTRDTVESR